MASADEAARSGPRGTSLISAGTAQFAGQALGIFIAVFVSHLIAKRMGIGAEADAFLLGRRLVTSVTEALSQVMVVVFIPLIAARAAAGVSGVRILGSAGASALALGAALAIAISLAAPDIVASLAPTFHPDTAALASKVVVILSMSLPATVAAMAFAAYCNVRGWFGVPTAIRQLPRASVALALLVGSGALALQASAAYTITYFAVALLTLVLALRLGPERPSATGTQSMSASVGRRGTAAILLTFGALANIWLETAVAARQGVGAVAMLDFSQRLGALCGNTLAMALGLVAFADLTKRAAMGETKELGSRFRQATLIGMVLLVPVQLGFFINAGSVIDLIIAHGRVDAETVKYMTELMRWMALAPFGALVTRMMLVRLLAQDDLPIVRLVGAGMALDFGSRLLLFTILTPVFGLAGIPIALVLAPAVPIVFLAFVLRRRGVFSGGGALRAARPIMAAAALGCAGILIGAAVAPAVLSLVRAPLADGSKLDSFVQLAGSGVLGLIALGLGIKIFGVKLRPR
ncbi:lipid II flippase MurJ [Marivita sp. S2033]|uniref:lipid II flippase MurJ n=1 Tax=Marivita sp. S2033 TaxID=3373187 RepID=UPI003982321F